MSDYPVPSHAATCWFTGDRLWLAFGPLTNGDHGHSVPYPIDLPALRTLSADFRELRPVVMALEALKARHATRAELGARGSPVRYDVEQSLTNDKKYNEWLKAMTVSKEEKAEAEEFLKELGL